MPKPTALLPYKPTLVETVSFGRIATVSVKPPPRAGRSWRRFYGGFAGNTDTSAGK